MGRCDRGVSTFNGAFRSGLAPCGRDCRIVWGRGNGRGRPSVGKAREVPGKKMVMGKGERSIMRKSLQIAKIPGGILFPVSPNHQDHQDHLCILPCSAPVEPHAQE